MNNHSILYVDGGEIRRAQCLQIDFRLDYMICDQRSQSQQSHIVYYKKGKGFAGQSFSSDPEGNKRRTDKVSAISYEDALVKYDSPEFTIQYERRNNSLHYHLKNQQDFYIVHSNTHLARTMPHHVIQMDPSNVTRHIHIYYRQRRNKILENFGYAFDASTRSLYIVKDDYMTTIKLPESVKDKDMYMSKVYLYGWSPILQKHIPTKFHEINIQKAAFKSHTLAWGTPRNWREVVLNMDTLNAARYYFTTSLAGNTIGQYKTSLLANKPSMRYVFYPLSGGALLYQSEKKDKKCKDKRVKKIKGLSVDESSIKSSPNNYIHAANSTSIHNLLPVFDKGSKKIRLLVFRELENDFDIFLTPDRYYPCLGILEIKK